ncbi:hypothetical protein MAR_031751 [Mya arenaria]|uniref:Uncharacterized protein n=1 Tax=Mya arenaria TaxID=6604 RepID=A0ABY7F806_MYAAR|nr:hypothetical protein MAR_031751 [Mya arenaria]
MNDHLKESIPFSHHVQFSDGCAAQFKSKRHFQHVSESKEPSMERAFFGSRHGKSRCDPLGGLVKKQSETFVRSRKGTIRDAKQMFEFCEANLSLNSGGKCEHKKRVFFYNETIKRDTENKKLKTLKGTHNVHNVRGVEIGKVEARNLSCFCDACRKGLETASCKNSSYVQDWEVHTISERSQDGKKQVNKKTSKGSKGKTMCEDTQKDAQPAKVNIGKRRNGKQSTDQKIQQHDLILGCKSFKDLKILTNGMNTEPLQEREYRSFSDTEEINDQPSEPMVADTDGSSPARDLDVPVDVIEDDGSQQTSMVDCGSDDPPSEPMVADTDGSSPARDLDVPVDDGSQQTSVVDFGSDDPPSEPIVADTYGSSPARDLDVPVDVKVDDGSQQTSMVDCGSDDPPSEPMVADTDGSSPARDLDVPVDVKVDDGSQQTSMVDFGSDDPPSEPMVADTDGSSPARDLDVPVDVKVDDGSQQTSVVDFGSDDRPSEPLVADTDGSSPARDLDVPVDVKVDDGSQQTSVVDCGSADPPSGPIVTDTDGSSLARDLDVPVDVKVDDGSQQTRYQIGNYIIVQHGQSLIHAVTTRQVTTLNFLTTDRSHNGTAPGAAQNCHPSGPLVSEKPVGYHLEAGKEGPGASLHADAHLPVAHRLPDPVLNSRLKVIAGRASLGGD